MPPRWPHRDARPVAWWACALFIAAAGLRLSGASANDPWADELFSWRLTQGSLARLVAELGGDVHPPLYFILLKMAVAVFGDSILALRLFSVAPSALTPPVLFLFLAPRLGLARAATAGVIAVLAPASILFSHQVRAYSWCELVALLVVISLWATLESHRVRALIGFTLSCTLLNFLHFIGPFFLAGLFAALLRLRMVGAIDGRRLAVLTTAMGLSGAALVPWAWFLLGHSPMIAAQSDIVTGLHGALEGGKILIKLLGGVVAAPAALLVWAAALRYRRRTRPADGAADLVGTAHILALVPLLLFTAQGMAGGPFVRLHPMIVALPWIGVVLADGLCALPRPARWVLGGAFAAGLVYSTATIPYRLSQVPFTAVLDQARARKLTWLITYGEELALTQRLQRRADVTLIDVRTMPATFCGGKVGLEIPADDADYDDTRHVATYGLIAPGGQTRSIPIPAMLIPAGTLRFDIANTWQPWETQTYRIVIFDTPACPPAPS